MYCLCVVLLMDCPRLYPLQILSRKWSYLVLRVLRERMHFSELQKELKFITNHMLARELKMLKDEGLLIAITDADAHIMYERTPAGTALVQALEPLVRW